MSTFKIHKVVSALPGTLVADTIYAVRVGTGFDLYVTDSSATIAFKVNSVVPAGGTTGQALVKSSNSDYALAWSTLGAGSGTVIYYSSSAPDDGGGNDGDLFFYTYGNTTDMYRKISGHWTYSGVRWLVKASNPDSFDLVSSTDPSAPAADTVRLFARKIAGRILPAYIGPLRVRHGPPAYAGPQQGRLLVPARQRDDRTWCVWLHGSDSNELYGHGENGCRHQPLLSDAAARLCHRHDGRHSRPLACWRLPVHLRWYRARWLLLCAPMGHQRRYIGFWCSLLCWHEGVFNTGQR